MGPHESLKDDKLVARVCAGHLECFETLVDRHLNHIRQFVAYHSPSVEQVDAITCETFVFALKNIHLFNPDAEFRGWLRAVALNLASAQCRPAPNTGTQDRFAQKRLAEFSRMPCDPYGASEIELLESCVHRLPSQHQELLKQHYFERRSARRLAARVGRPPNTLRLALLRLRQELIGCMKRKKK